MRSRGGRFLGLRTHYQVQRAGEVSAMREDRQRELSGRRTKINLILGRGESQRGREGEGEREWEGSREGKRERER